MGIPAEKLRYHDHVKLAHYADAAVDIEYQFPFGWKELEGIHSRTITTWARHQEFSRKKMQYFDNDINPGNGQGLWQLCSVRSGNFGWFRPFGAYLPF